MSGWVNQEPGAHKNTENPFESYLKLKTGKNVCVYNFFFNQRFFLRFFSEQGSHIAVLWEKLQNGSSTIMDDIGKQTFAIFQFNGDSLYCYRSLSTAQSVQTSHIKTWSIITDIVKAFYKMAYHYTILYIAG